MIKLNLKRNRIIYLIALEIVCFLLMYYAIYFMKHGDSWSDWLPLGVLFVPTIRILYNILFNLKEYKFTQAEIFSKNIILGTSKSFVNNVKYFRKEFYYITLLDKDQNVVIKLDEKDYANINDLMAYIKSEEN